MLIKKRPIRTSLNEYISLSGLPVSLMFQYIVHGLLCLCSRQNQHLWIILKRSDPAFYIGRIIFYGLLFQISDPA